MFTASLISFTNPLNIKNNEQEVRKSILQSSSSVTYLRDKTRKWKRPVLDQTQINSSRQEED